jgi:outer membrane protein OmpA-like peptidoglycan-associated protein
MHRELRAFGAAASIAIASACFAAEPPPPATAEVNLASYASGAWIVKRPPEYDESWSSAWLLDERSDSGWATPKGVVAPQQIVIELGQRSLVKAVEFDTGAVDGDSQGSRGAADIVVEVSDVSADSGFDARATLKLAPRKDRQRFALDAPRPGRWIRLTVKTNHGSNEYIELFEFRAFGDTLGTPAPAVSMTGTYRTNYGNFHMVQQGSTLLGCYEFKGGLVENGGVEGRVARFTWKQDSAGGPLPWGPTFFAFSPDGKEFIGLWWYETRTSERGQIWAGTRISDKAGTCAHWKGAESSGAQLAAQLGKGEHARLYGIRFDVDSDVLRQESTAALESIAKLARDNPSWGFSIEGHTDATASAAYNQALSQRRAEAVKAWLVKAGIAAGRLVTQGLGATKPVADNATGIGRAQNRRVELARS